MTGARGGIYSLLSWSSVACSGWCETLDIFGCLPLQSPIERPSFDQFNYLKWHIRHQFKTTSERDWVGSCWDSDTSEFLGRRWLSNVESPSNFSRSSNLRPCGVSRTIQSSMKYSGFKGLNISCVYSPALLQALFKSPKIACNFITRNQVHGFAGCRHTSFTADLTMESETWVYQTSIGLGRFELWVSEGRKSVRSKKRCFRCQGRNDADRASEHTVWIVGQAASKYVDMQCRGNRTVY